MSIIAIIQLYRYLISPVIRPCCRFHPSCSCYALDAVKKHHVLRALWLIIFRIVRCHPLHPGGYDPVPEKRLGLREKKLEQNN